MAETKIKYVRGGIAEKLRLAIKDSQMTHYAIGKAADVSPAMIDRFMSGERDLRFSSADKIAKVLELTLKSDAD